MTYFQKQSILRGIHLVVTALPSTATTARCNDGYGEVRKRGEGRDGSMELNNPLILGRIRFELRQCSEKEIGRGNRYHFNEGATVRVGLMLRYSSLGCYQIVRSLDQQSLIGLDSLFCR